MKSCPIENPETDQSFLEVKRIESLDDDAIFEFAKEIEEERKETDIKVEKLE